VVPDDSLWCFFWVHSDGKDVTPDRTNTIPDKRLAWDNTVEGMGIEYLLMYIED
jgi:hypothetical protein